MATRGFAVSKLIDSQATQAAMVSGIQSLIAAAVSGDVVVITFSGHGTTCRIPTATRSMASMRRSVRTTFRPAVRPDRRRDQYAVQRAKGGVRLVLISDSCHSGDRDAGFLPARFPAWLATCCWPGARKDQTTSVTTRESAVGPAVPSLTMRSRH
ncbi:MAG: caspase family protein [Candidatus Accumulibacter sp.]|uniref:Caspase family protein n=1 Tax=Candidatus Accumulibacter proximus TaxID=2954385 RepID=A0A935Q2P6_9PROT|nr:caspase family protein [Candidatus Accumulibacter proximus]